MVFLHIKKVALSKGGGRMRLEIFLRNCLFMNFIEKAYSNNLSKLSEVIFTKSLCSNEKIDKFTITNKKQAKENSVLFINGFLNENEESIEEWNKYLKLIWNKESYYYLSWGSKTPIDILLSKIDPNETNKSTWLKALNNAEKTGKLLAKVLENYENKIILCGHSLGARVIYYALKELEGKSQNICEVHLLGGAVENSRENWGILKNYPNTKVYNYYSYNDNVLQYLYKIGTLFNSEPIGRNVIDMPQVINIDTTHRVKGHSDYKSHFATFYQKYKNKGFC